MKKMTSILMLLFIMGTVNANDCSIITEVFAFDENDTFNDYNGLSPLASYGVKCSHNIDNNFSISAGLKHTSSTGYREIGGGFNGFTFGAEFKFISW